MIELRSTKFKQGLIDMIAYVNQFYNTRKLILLEIGSFAGNATEIFAQNFKGVVAVEPWKQKLLHSSMQKFDIKQAEKDFDNRIMKRFKNVEKEKGTSMEYLKRRKYEFDIIYIDGCHDYEFVKQDILEWQKYCRLFMAGHDYLPLHEGVIKAVDEIYNKPDKVFCDFSWIVRI
jgi:hypothetical protein